MSNKELHYLTFVGDKLNGSFFNLVLLKVCGQWCSNFNAAFTLCKVMNRSFWKLSQGLQTTPTAPAHLATGAVGLDPPSFALQAPRGPFLELLHPSSVNPAQGEPSAQTLGLPGSPMWRGSLAGLPISVPWVGLSTQFIVLAYISLWIWWLWIFFFY